MKKKTITAPSWLLGVLPAVTVLALLAGPAFAQRRVNPNVLPELDYSPPWVGILYTLIFIAGIVVVGFKNARRTHLD